MRARTASCSRGRVTVTGTVIAMTLLAGLSACGDQSANQPAALRDGKQEPSIDRDRAQTAFTPEQLKYRAIERRAIEAVIWGMPAVNYDLMYQAMVREAKGASNQVAYWSRLPDWKIQTLTPNPDAIYFTPFIDTKDVGPVVIEIPPADEGSITGTIMDVWQSALEDVGPAGVDRGQGGKYLFLPPGYKGRVPAGYIALASDTYAGYALLRSIPKSGSESDVAQAVAYGKRIKLYPLSQAANPPATTFLDVVDVVYDSTIPYDLRFFESLNRIVQTEPWLERDKAMIDQLKSIGLEKGRLFTPDPKMKDVLTDAAREAHAWLVTQYEASFSSPYYESGHWSQPGSRELFEGQATFFAKPDVYPIDVRGVTFSYAYFTPKHVGAGASYLITIADKDGRLLDGGASYRLSVPANAPVKQYWSATVYDRSTHAPIRNARWLSRSSQTPGLQRNADGSTDLYLGSKAPVGKESNWVPTSGEGGFEVLFRFYGPEKALFEKTWRLPDIEKIGLSDQREGPVTTTTQNKSREIETRIGALQFTHGFADGFPTDSTVDKLYDERDFQRACQAYLWSLPAVAFTAWQRGVTSGLGARNGQIVAILSYEARRGVLTANATTPYYLGFADLSSGPFVLEMPASGVQGAMNDSWQNAIPGTEMPGKYLVLAPGQKVPDDVAGYFVRHSPTVNVFLGVRLTESDPARAQEALAHLQMYPYAQRHNPPRMEILDAGTREWSGLPPRGMEYWERVNDVIQREPIEPRDIFFHAMLRPLGLEKGKLFKPDARQTKILTDAALVGEAMAKANSADRRFAGVKYRSDAHWDFALALDADAPDEFWNLLDERAAWFYEAVGAGAAMAPKHPGPSSAYLSAYKDKAGKWLDGGNSYRLHVPPNPPIKLFWSVTLYDVDTRALILNDQKIADRSSRMDLRMNPDGSVDIYCGPKAPAGFEKNWVPTVPGKNWFAYFRFYNPTESYFDRSWPLPDFEQLL